MTQSTERFNKKMNPSLHASLGIESFDFYACYKCGGLITAPEMAAALESNGLACKCGSTKVRPTNISLKDWFKPRVLRFALLRLLGRA